MVITSVFSSIEFSLTQLKANVVNCVCPKKMLVSVRCAVHLCGMQVRLEFEKFSYQMSRGLLLPWYGLGSCLAGSNGGGRAAAAAAAE